MKKPNFRWKCRHCNRRNMEYWIQTFEMPHRYEGPFTCNHCGCENYLRVALEVFAKKPPTHG